MVSGNSLRRLWSPPQWQSARILQHAGDTGIAVCLFVVPLLLGGRHDAGRFVFSLGAALAGVGVYGGLALQGMNPSVPSWLLSLVAAALLLVGVQVVPLPALVHGFGPDVQSLLPLWGEGTQFGAWRTLSLTPSATRLGLALLAAHALFLSALIERLARIEDVCRLLRWVAAGASGMVLIALFQYAIADDKLLGIYDHPFREFSGSLQGTFANKNHFAHFVLLGIGPAAWLVFADRSKASVGREGNPTRLAWGGALVALSVSVFASQSRGAVAALAVATLIGIVLAWRNGDVRLKHVTILSMVVVGGFVGVSFFGYDRVGERMSGLVSGQMDQLDALESRRSIWAANLDAFMTSPWFGFGAGSHREVYPLFLSIPTTREFTHAESGYLQIASENGLSGLALLLAFLGFLLLAVVRGATRSGDSRVAWLWVAIAMGLASSAAHSCVDFVWYLPGLMAPTLALVACAIRLEVITRDATSHAKTQPRTAQVAGPLPKLTGWRAGRGYLAFGIAAGVGSFAMIGLFNPAVGSADWDRYLRASVSLRGMLNELHSETNSSKLTETIEASTGQMVACLTRVVEADPNNARAHLRLSRRLLQLDEARVNSGESVMSLDSIRDAALNGGFASHSAMQRWLDRAFPERAPGLRRAYRHARTSLLLCPLQGEAYQTVAKLSFLSPDRVEQLDLIGQSLIVRPYDGKVLFEGGRTQWFSGHPEECLTLWKRCINRPGVHQHRLVGLYAAMGPAEGLIQDLDPGPVATGIALRLYEKVGQPEDLIVICDHASALAREAERKGSAHPEDLAEQWRLVSSTLRLVNREQEAVAAAQRAVELAPQWFPARLEMAAAWRAVKQFDKADPHIRWCVARRPDIRHLTVWLEESAKWRTEAYRNQQARLSGDRLVARARHETDSISPPADSSDKPGATADNRESQYR